VAFLSLWCCKCPTGLLPSRGRKLSYFWVSVQIWVSKANSRYSGTASFHICVLFSGWIPSG